MKTIIELSERLMDAWYDKHGQRRTKWHVQIKDKGGYWSCGRTPKEAIDGLITSHSEMFPLGSDGCTVIYLGENAR